MANSIDAVIGSEAIKQVENLIAKLNLADAELIKISQSATTASKGISSISTPSGLGKAVDDTNKLNTELDRQNNIIKALEIEIKKLSYARQSNNKQSAEEAVNQRVLNQNAIAQAKATSNLVGAYQKLDLEHKKAVTNAQNLGVQYGITSNQFKKASTEANKLDKELKEIDASLGKSQRNVGNYQSAFNGLGNALGAFGVVGGIAGFVGLGKEIFTTTAEIQSLDNALKLVTETQVNFAEQQIFLQRVSESYGADINSLTKQFTQFYVSAKDKISGNEIQDIFESITKAGASMGLSTQQQERAFLALNQMMSKGTIQAEELRGQLGEALPGAFGIMAKAMGVTEKQLGQMMKDGEVLASDVLPKFAKQLEITYGIENLTRVENLTSAQTRLSNAWKDFVRSLDEDGNKMSKLFGFLLNQVTDTIKGWRTILTSGATSTKNDLSRIRAESKKETIDFYNDVKNLDKEDVKNKKAKYEEEARSIRRNYENLANINKSIQENGVRSPFGQLTKEDSSIIANNKKQMETLNQSLSVYYGNIEGLTDVLKPKVKAEIEDVKVKKEKIKATKLETVSNLELVKTEDTALERLKLLKKALEQTRDETSKNSAEFQQFETTIKEVNESIDFLTKGIQPIKLDIKLPFKKGELKEMSEEVKNYLKSFSSEFLSNSGFGETFSLLNKEIEGFGTNFAVTFNAIAESAQEAFNFISNASQANFEAENARVQAQYDTALKFAGGSTVAEAKLREDLEKKKKEIANRENKAKQKQALFNIAIDTAQGIVSALATANIPLSIAIGILGAVQLGLVASQKIPQYFDGTDNHSGGLMLVNDGEGANYQEKIILPNGKEIIPEGRNVLMNAPAGTKVLTHEQQIAQMLNERGISMSANFAKSNGMTSQEMDNVLTKHFANIQTNHTSIDENGFRSWSNKNGNKTINSNNRVQRIGINV
jgi:tape measure domain-containing protein